MSTPTTKADDGGPAFPIDLGESCGIDPRSTTGMSLRDFFAANLQFPDNMDFAIAEALVGPKPDGTLEMVEWEVRAMAKFRYIMADAMLAARKAVAQ